MGFNNTNNKKTSTPNTNTSQAGSSQPSAFRPTKKGLQNATPWLPATQDNSNGSLKNLAAKAVSPYLMNTYLFITDVATGWTLSGDYGQAPLARTFFPQNLTQNQIAIQGQVANQYEYDKLVSFVEHHHVTAINADAGQNQNWLVFTLLPWLYDYSQQIEVANPNIDINAFTPIKKTIISGMKYGVTVDTIQAGHQRFINAPTFQLTCTVMYDYLDPRPYNAPSAQNANLSQNYIQTFGTLYDPNTTGAQSTTPTNTKSGT